MEKIDQKDLIGITALLIHAAKIDENYSEKEKKIIKDFLKKFESNVDTQKKILDGADISTKSLEISCQKFIYDKLYKFNFQKKKFNFRVQKYDCIVCVGSLTYCEDFNLLINKLEKKLIKKGYFIFTHRNDLWKKDHFTKLIKNLKNWKIIYTSNLLEYLPLNKDFSDKIKIRICLLRKK